ncbi:hydantoinase B/oxoprolinase family protein [Chelatococcus asaccharovorans]|uniref:N-methylhydantoinase B n=1 Tax=Chelatococcus asaccharovorans TaxID=28210 RepID=A0A2V3U835_9HYPH|nr:hydantoinase B/oxoprolinase family protein [Chelatococcus asaccharovorans]MBS7705620.1 hydantoinase B/oxoprolinase family protein [Chelatococcus asaccharovorans]PXW59967.1 N-methylhydantoinase B [Chelatococcus asaccharovorans]
MSDTDMSDTDLRDTDMRDVHATARPAVGSAIDPITLEVIRNALASTADEMALIIMRSAYSPVVRDIMDYSTGLCDAQGRVIAQGLTLPIQLCSFPRIMQFVRERFGATLKEGDVLIANDPYGSGGQHLPDVYILKPIFADGVLAGFAATVAHHTDLGGIVPGSVAIYATEIQQEGLRLPLLKLYEAGKANDAVFGILEANTRSPVEVLGDIRAQIAACNVAEEGLKALVSRYGKAQLDSYIEALHDHAEAMMRQTIRDLPNGVYRATDYIDGVGENPAPLAIVATVTVGDDTIDIDFTGTADQVAASINCPISLPESAAFSAIRCLSQQDIPNCEGYLRPITVRAPEGCLVNPRYPAACGARGVVGYRVFDAIMQALAQVVPERAIGGSEGGPYLLASGGLHRGRPFVLNEMVVGTWGARATKDGIEGISNPAANLSNQPIEMIETDMPIEVLDYGLVPDSGGPGEFRGGLAFVRSFRFLTDARFTLRGDRRAHPPYGVEGGGTGTPSEHLLVRLDGSARNLPTMPMESFTAHAGEVFRLTGAGGGGYGNPLMREPWRVLDDIREGKVTREGALRDYAVVVGDDLTVDAVATQRLRRERGLEQQS